MSLQTALESFVSNVKAFFSAEIAVAEAIGETIVQGAEAVATGLEPTAVNDLKNILQGIEDDFKKGSTLDMIVEEVKNRAGPDLKALLDAAEPQLLSTLVGILIKAL